MTAEPADTDGPRATPGTPAPSADFYDEAEWTQVLVGIGERFRSRVDGKVLHSMLSELLAAHTEFAAAATADRVRHDASQAAPGAADRITEKLSGLQSAVGDVEATYSTMGSGLDEGSPAGVAEREIDRRQILAAAQAEAELVREQAVTMAESMIATAADEADRRRRANDEAIDEGRVATAAEAVKVLEEALADADFVRTSAEEAGARTLAEAEAGAEALRRAVVDEIAALRTSAEADIAALRAAHDASPKPDGVAGDAVAALDAAKAEARAIREAADADARAIRDEAAAIREAAEAAARTIRDAAPRDATVDGDGVPEVDAAPDRSPDGARRRGLYRRRRLADVADVADVAGDPAATAPEDPPTAVPIPEADPHDAPSESYRRRRRGGTGA